MAEKVFLIVRPAERDEVFTDMVRIHRSHRIKRDNSIIPAGKVIRIDHAGKHVYAIARGLPETIPPHPERDRALLMDEFIRQRLAVSSGDRIDHAGSGRRHPSSASTGTSGRRIPRRMFPRG